MGKKVMRVIKVAKCVMYYLNGPLHNFPSFFRWVPNDIVTREYQNLLVIMILDLLSTVFAYFSSPLIVKIPNDKSANNNGNYNGLLYCLANFLIIDPITTGIFSLSEIKLCS